MKEEDACRRQARTSRIRSSDMSKPYTGADIIKFIGEQYTDVGIWVISVDKRKCSPIPVVSASHFAHQKPKEVHYHGDKLRAMDKNESLISKLYTVCQ